MFRIWLHAAILGRFSRFPNGNLQHTICFSARAITTAKHGTACRGEGGRLSVQRREGLQFVSMTKWNSSASKKNRQREREEKNKRGRRNNKLGQAKDTNVSTDAILSALQVATLAASPPPPPPSFSHSFYAASPFWFLYTLLDWPTKDASETTKISAQFTIHSNSQTRIHSIHTHRHTSGFCGIMKPPLGQHLTDFQTMRICCNEYPLLLCHLRITTWEQRVIHSKPYSTAIYPAGNYHTLKIWYFFIIIHYFIANILFNWFVCLF